MDNKILIVDDEKVLSEILKDFFEDFDWVVDLAFTGEEALKLFELNDYKVAIVDMKLPDMYGNEIILNAYKIRNNTKYFIHTGSLDYVVSDDLVNLGLSNDSIIFKPIRDMEELYRKIEKSL